MAEHKTILAFGGHMDDPELGCGGTLLKAARNGHRVVCVIMAGRFHNFRSLDAHKPEELIACNNAIMKKYGFEPKRFLDFEYMEMQEDRAGKKLFSEIIQEVRPDVVFAHTRHDRWSDHAVCGRLVEHAAMFSHLYTNTTFHRPEIYFYETSFVQVYADRFRPDVFIDVSDVFDEVIEMMAPHDEILQAHRSPDGKAPVHAEVELRLPKACHLTLTQHGMVKFARCKVRAHEAGGDGFVEAFESMYPATGGERVLYDLVRQGPA